MVLPAWLERLNAQFPLRYTAWLLSALGALLGLFTWVGFGVGGWFALVCLALTALGVFLFPNR